MMMINFIETENIVMQNYIIKSETITHLSLTSILGRLYNNIVFVRCCFYCCNFSGMEDICSECEHVWLISSWSNVANIHRVCSSTGCVHNTQLFYHCCILTQTVEEAEINPTTLSQLCSHTNL